MEVTTENQFMQQDPAAPVRPEFLKILCIFSFVACGLMILLCALGTTCLAMSEDMVSSTWTTISESNPELENINPMDFFHAVGMFCLYGLIINIFSLVGVIMMWNLEKVGFFIYAIAEIVSNFNTVGLDLGEKSKSYGGLIFWLLMDLIFIGMYFVNLKYMNKRKATNTIQ